MPLVLVALAAALVGAALVAGAAVLLRRIDARPGLGRRLGGARQLKVGQVLDGEGGDRPVRIVGRIRCADPLHLGGGERLVAYHRDVEVEVGGRWLTLERLRETRSFELWDHDGSLAVDPAHAAEPLVSIPQVWRGSPAELQEPHASAVAALVERDGAPATAARAVTRGVNVTDRLLVLALVRRDVGGGVALEPPPGGYVISTLALPDAMRLLGGPHRRLVAVAIGMLAAGVVLAGIGGVAAIGLVLAGA